VCDEVSAPAQGSTAFTGGKATEVIGLSKTFTSSRWSRVRRKPHFPSHDYAASLHAGHSMACRTTLLTKSTPMVEMYESVNASSANRRRRHDFPTPVSPISTSLNRKS
jgi:hypothetical protein